MSPTTSPKKNNFVRGDDDGDNSRSTYLKDDKDVTGKRHARQHDTSAVMMVRKTMMMTKAVASGGWDDETSGMLMRRTARHANIHYSEEDDDDDKGDSIRRPVWRNIRYADETMLCFIVD